MAERRATLRNLAEINVTPFVDVLLVLLIIFMVITPLSTRGLDAALPAESTDGSHGPPPLVLELRGSELTLNGTPVGEPPELERTLRDVLAARSDKTLFVRVAGGGVRYGRTVEVLDAARGAGAGRIGLMKASAPGR